MGHTLPPRTSSPMIIHPAVCIIRLLFSSAVTDGMMLLLRKAVEATADECA